jgi:hypothetical protein
MNREKRDTGDILFIPVKFVTIQEFCRSVPLKVFRS